MFSEDTSDLFKGGELEDTRTETQKLISSELIAKENRINVSNEDLPMFTKEYQTELF